MVKAVGVDAVCMHREVSHNEVKAEEKIEEVMKDEGVEVKYFWGSTLYHLEDFPFALGEMSSNYGGFKERVKGLEARKTIEALEKMKDLPERGDVEAGEIPSLVDLGLKPNAANMTQDAFPFIRWRNLFTMEIQAGVYQMGNFCISILENVKIDYSRFLCRDTTEHNHGECFDLELVEYILRSVVVLEKLVMCSSRESFF